MANSDEFYAKILPLYDKLISYENRKERETPFWKKLFNKYQILNAHDCACGTGHHLLIFNELGISCSGSDLSDAMVNEAKKKCEERNLKNTIFQADFRNIKTYLKKPVDLIVNLGNSLAYLSKEEYILVHLKGCNSSLSNEGVLVIDTRNYDYLLKERPRFIPLSFREDYGFIYAIDYLKESIQFNVLYFNLSNKDFQKFSTTYYPILYEKLIHYLKESGFEFENQYSNYNFEAFNLNTSSNLIIVAKKK
jgi:SAM-dependent methyltransferase